MTFSSTVALGVRKNCWNTNPNVRLRSSLRRRPLSVLASTPPITTLPLLGVSSRARMCMRVDLPDPLLPTIATDSPSAMFRLTPFSASNRVEPLP